MLRFSCLRASLATATVLVIAGASAQAQPDASESRAAYPVAVRYWGGPTVTLETWSHAPVVIDPTREAAALWGDEPLGGLHATRDQLDVEIRKSFVKRIDNRSAADAVYEDHDISFISKPPLAMRWAVDGVVIIHWAELGEPTEDDPRAGDKPIDLLILPIDDSAPPAVGKALQTVAALEPRFVLPVGAPGATTGEAKEAVAAFLELGKQQFAIVDVPHNTYAIGASGEDEPRTATVLHLAAKPWAPSNELAKLLEKMDAACRASQKVFAHLSARQMNYRPSDGTHTPRWNAEHMTGRQLGFFTQIYAEIQPDAFSHLDLNPAQMPDDYQPAYPDWSGAQQAAQMQRANAYVRRFAYLLDGLPMDERAPGSRWTPRRLLEQMDRHFREHTANVVKKFDLPDWPEK